MMELLNRALNNQLDYPYTYKNLTVPISLCSHYSFKLNILNLHGETIFFLWGNLKIETQAK